MNRYETSIPRTVFAIAAVAMTAITLGVSVVVPSTWAAGSQQARALATSNGRVAAPTEVAIEPARIDVFGRRAQATAYEPGRESLPRHGQAG